MAAPDCEKPVYHPASFKNVPFHCDGSSDEMGRRSHLYEYPLSEDVALKDLGRKARRFRLEGYLIGTNQIALTRAMADAAESPEPGILIHPIYGSQRVSCVSLTTTADYRQDIKRTKLSFEFLEANESLAPFAVGAGSVSKFHKEGSDAVRRSVASGEERWVPSEVATEAATEVSTNLAVQIVPATDEASYDAISALQRGFFPLFTHVADPIDKGTVTVRRIHADDGLRRLRDFNRHIVLATPQETPSVQALIVTARLALARDYTLIAAAKTYQTVHAALLDLDFIVALYDEEEVFAVEICDDALVMAIRTARALAVQTILYRNIRLPGIVTFEVGGVYPSLVVAHKKYFDGRRYEDVENYNPRQNPFFVGREITVPAS